MGLPCFLPLLGLYLTNTMSSGVIPFDLMLEFKFNGLPLVTLATILALGDALYCVTQFMMAL